MTSPEEKATWITVITREQKPEVLTWPNEIEARAYFSNASWQWSESFLARIVVGVGPQDDDELDRNHLADLVSIGIRDRRVTTAALRPFADAAAQYDEPPPAVPLFDGIVVPRQVSDDDVIDSSAGITVGMLRAARAALEGDR